MPFVPPVIPSTNHYRRFGWGPLIAFLAAIAVVVAILNAVGTRFTWRGTPDGTILGTWDRTSSAWPEIREGQPTAVQSHDHTFSTPGGVLIAIHFTTSDFDIAKKGHVRVPISAQAILRQNVRPGARIFENPDMFSTDPTPLPGDPGDVWVAGGAYSCTAALGSTPIMGHHRFGTAAAWGWPGNAGKFVHDAEIRPPE
jgi:hypothetical protein